MVHCKAHQSGQTNVRVGNQLAAQGEAENASPESVPQNQKKHT